MRDILIRNVTAITMDRKQEVLPEADILIREGKIAEIGTGRMPNIPQAEEIEGRGKVLMPGLIDCRVDIQPSAVGRRTGLAFGRLAAARAILSGVTTLLGFAQEGNREFITGFLDGCREIGVNAILGTPEEKECSAGITAYPVREGDLPRLWKMGKLKPGVLCEVEEESVLPLEELRLLCQAKVSACFRASRGHRRNWVGEMIESGVPTTVSSRMDQPGLLEGARNLVFLERLVHDDERYFPAGKLLEMLTIDAAQCLGIGSKTGSIEMGKRADLILIHAAQARLSPMHLPVQQVAYHATGSDIHTVLVGGRVVVRGHQIVSGDGKEIRYEARKAWTSPDREKGHFRRSL